MRGSDGGAGGEGLGLLLCDADERAPVLPGGLPADSLEGAPAPPAGPRGGDSLQLEDLAGDPNDLAAQRWAVVAPEGPAGDELVAAMRPLIEHRRAQQGAEPRIFRVPGGMDAAAAARWKHGVLRAEDVPADERPRYLMILGDLDRVSLELQHALANGAFVGRVHCPTSQGVGAYAEKVVARERGAAGRRARALYYTVQDGTPAIAAGHRHLVAPSLRMTAELAGRGKLDVEGPTEVVHSEWGPDELLAITGIEAPSLLVSLGHGLGAPRRGWKTPDHQRALQGALSLGGEEALTAEVLREARFLPGGVWLSVACYGAGTPASSAFHPWLAQLEGHGLAAGAAEAVLRALPRAGERPFVAALPQALLANAGGPVAVIGHVDLAWTFGFTDPGGKHSRASRLHAAQRALLAGNRAGVALDAILHAYREVNDEVMASYQGQREALARGQRDPVDPRRLGEAWMQRNDLRGYVLLGDPAARLAIAAGPRATVEAAELREPARRPIEVVVAAAEPREPARRPIEIVVVAPEPALPPEPAAPPGPVTSPVTVRATEVTMSTSTPPDPPAPQGAAPPGAIVRPRTLENPEIGLRERAVLAMIRGDEAPRSVAVRFGLPLEELFYWLDVYREAGRRALAG